MSTKEPRTASFSEFKWYLDEVRSKSSDYSKLFHERVEEVSLEETVTAIRDRVDPERPYFFGQLSNGIRFAGDARDFPSILHAMEPDCNSTLIKALIAEVHDTEGDIIDVGANLGVVSASLARHVNKRGHVHGFEPSPETFKLTAATIALNELNNVTLTEAAVGEIDGEIRFHATPGNSAVASSYHHEFPFLNVWKEIVVPCRRIDTLFSRALKKIALIKIDVEGNEMEVLRGAQEVIRAFIPKIVYEYTPIAAGAHGWSDHDTTALLEGLMPFQFNALIEPPFEAMGSNGRWIPFPLPYGVKNQVNVFARPMQHATVSVGIRRFFEKFRRPKHYPLI